MREKKVVGCCQVYVSNEVYQKAYDNPENQSVMKWVVGSFTSQWRNFFTYDDFWAAAIDALNEALRNHDASYNTRFTSTLKTYVEWRCQRVVNRAARHLKKRKSIQFHPDVSTNTNFDSEVIFAEDVKILENHLADIPRQDAEYLYEHASRRDELDFKNGKIISIINRIRELSEVPVQEDVLKFDEPVKTTTIKLRLNEEESHEFTPAQVEQVIYMLPSKEKKFASYVYLEGVQPKEAFQKSQLTGSWKRIHKLVQNRIKELLDV